MTPIIIITRITKIGTRMGVSGADPVCLSAEKTRTINNANIKYNNE